MHKVLFALCLMLSLSMALFSQGSNFYRCTSFGPTPVATPEGYTISAEVNLGVGVGEVKNPYSTNQMGVTMVNGYHFNPFFMAGVGVGVYSFNEGSVAPLYADARYFFKMKCVNPFIVFDGGVILPIAGEPAKTGPFVFLGGGARVPLAPRLSLTAAAGPHLHWNDKSGVRDALISLKVGLVFH